MQKGRHRHPSGFASKTIRWESHGRSRARAYMQVSLLCFGLFYGCAVSTGFPQEELSY